MAIENLPFYFICAMINTMPHALLHFNIPHWHLGISWLCTTCCSFLFRVCVSYISCIPLLFLEILNLLDSKASFHILWKLSLKDVCTAECWLTRVCLVEWCWITMFITTSVCFNNTSGLKRMLRLRSKWASLETLWNRESCSMAGHNSWWGNSISCVVQT